MYIEYKDSATMINKLPAAIQSTAYPQTRLKPATTTQPAKVRDTEAGFRTDVEYIFSQLLVRLPNLQQRVPTTALLHTSAVRILQRHSIGKFTNRRPMVTCH